MRANDLETLIAVYEQKRRRKEYDLNNRKKELYKKIPRLEEIEDEINKISINKTKSILIHGLTDSLNTEYENNLYKLKKEKEEILKKENIDETFFKIKYDCEKCKDTGYISFENKKTEMCSCLRQKLINASYNKSNLSNLQNENFGNFDSNKFSDEVDIEKYKINFSPRANINAIKNASINFVKNFENPRTKNLFFTGNTGLRKNIYDKLHSKRIVKQWKNSTIPNSTSIARNNN